MGDRILIRCHAIKYALCYCNSVKGVVETAVFCFSLKCWTADICSKGKIFRHLPVYEKVTFCLSSNIHCVLVCHICSWLRSRFRKSLQPMWQTSVWESRGALSSPLSSLPPSLCGIFLCVSSFILHTHAPINLSKVWVDLIFSSCLSLATSWTLTLSKKHRLQFVFFFVFLHPSTKSK